MKMEFEALDPHQKWQELCALETTGTLDASDQERLRAHLKSCTQCRAALAEYETLAHQGMPRVAEQYLHVDDLPAELEDWDADAAKQQLFAKLDEPVPATASPSFAHSSTPHRKIAGIALWAGLAASFAIALAVTSYQLGKRSAPVAQATSSPLLAQVQSLSAERAELDQRLGSENAAFAALEKQTAETQEQMAALQSRLHDSEARADEASNSSTAANQQLQSAISDRDGLTRKLQDLGQSYQSVETELSNLKTQRQQDLLHNASLEVEVNDLNRRLHDTEGRENADTQYLASDRDIREIMGARQLYIADVTDVDQNGKARKPFGRVFYTKGKSLIFYAFDLDQQPAVKEASTFQAWAREGSDTAKPISLGIFYMDSEANRRWVLKTEDPKVLAQVNAVFVTVEPKGGSQRPSGKQLLYAYLRSVTPNHP
jgi:regulator of replication initiation timing